MTDEFANQSQDLDHASAHNGSSVNQIRYESDKSKAWIVGLIMLGVMVACNIGWTINLALKYEAFAAEDHHLSQLKWLHDEDLMQFKMGPFADLKTEVEVSQKLFQTCRRSQ